MNYDLVRLFHYHVSIFNNVDVLILIYVQMDLIVLYLYPLFVISYKVFCLVFCFFFPVSMVFYSCPVMIFALC